jgi:hypothetical protein
MTPFSSSRELQARAAIDKLALMNSSRQLQARINYKLAQRTSLRHLVHTIG